MDKSEEYTALAWFVAGFVAADENPPRAATSEGLRRARSALEDHRSGACLACGREGVVILDGYFCERCAPGLGEVGDGE